MTVEAKFKVGQVVMWKRSEGKRPMPFVVIEVIHDTELPREPFYRIDRKNALAEHMLRALNEEELGAKSERRATLTACLEVVNAEIDAAKKCAKLSEKKEFYAKVYAQTEIAAACERIATRLKQLEEK